MQRHWTIWIDGPVPPSRRAFTLVELVMVIVILGILAAIAIPKFADASSKARVNVLVDRYKLLYRTYETYFRETGTWPPDNDGSTGQPFFAAKYFADNPWEEPSPVGGLWNWNYFSPSEVDVCIYTTGAPTPSLTATMTAVDAALDDGNLSTGMFTYDPSWNHTYRYFLRKP